MLHATHFVPDMSGNTLNKDWFCVIQGELNKIVLHLWFFLVDLILVEPNLAESNLSTNNFQS